jgi:stearoyl-CoA desaturase (delta-9 desaturase)
MNSLGSLSLPWWGYVCVTLALTHLTIVAVTVYLHRSQAHRSIDLHPAVSHAFRFWLWLTTGIVTKEWVAVHRKHHANVETGNDPHSPQTHGIRKVFWEGAELYRAAAENRETLQRYGHGTPDDWLERNVYARHSWHGCAVMLIIDLALFGTIGLTIWAVQMMWIPIMAAGIVNGIGHYWGYRNFSCKDASRNIVPWGILIGGEELHNNHHAYGSSAKLAVRWYEVDLGWMYICALQVLRLANVRKTAPRLKLDQDKWEVDTDTLEAIITHRYAVVSSYMQSLKQAYCAEVVRQRKRCSGLAPSLPTFRCLREWFQADESALPEADRLRLAQTLRQSAALNTIYAMGRDLVSLWERSTASRDELLARLEDWCHRAEASDIVPLQRFSRHLRRYA